MGNYNKEYESYYAKVIGKRKTNDGYRRDFSFGGLNEVEKKTRGNKITRRVIQELIGTFILFTLIFILKTINTPQTIVAYKVAKDVVENGYDINETLQYASSINILGVREKAQEYFEKFKEKYGALETIKTKTKGDFVKPILGEYKVYDESKRIYSVSVSEATDVIAVYDGRIKKISEDEIFGKYIVVDNGSGIESVYGGFEDITQNIDDDVKIGETLGKVNLALKFQLKYMGQGKVIEDYMDI